MSEAHFAIQANTVNGLTVMTDRPCTLNAIHMINSTSTSFVQVFDAAATTDVTLGTTLARYVLTAGSLGVSEGLVGGEIGFVNGIVIAVTDTAISSSTRTAHVRIWIH